MKKQINTKDASNLGWLGMAFLTLGTPMFLARCKIGEPVITKLTCECETKDHLGVGEKCCDYKDCTCELKVYGSFTDDSDNIIPIYRNGNVTEAQMATAVTNVIEAYNVFLSDGHRIMLDNKLKAIHIGIEGEWGCDDAGDGKYIITFAHNISSNGAANSFGYYIDNTIAKSQQYETVKLAKEFNKPAAKSATIAWENANFDGDRHHSTEKNYRQLIPFCLNV